MRALLLLFSIAVASSAPAVAQEAAAPSFTVRPSGFEDDGSDARRRHERLSRRLDESEFTLRSICRNCSRMIAQGLSPLPFRPVETLDGARK